MTPVVETGQASEIAIARAAYAISERTACWWCWFRWMVRTGRMSR